MKRPLPIRPAAVIFDMDGLLFDSEILYRDAFLATASTMGYALTAQQFRLLVGNPWAANRAILRDLLGPNGNPDAFRAAWIQGYERIKDTLALKAGVIELLDHLDRLKLPRAICTSSSQDDVWGNLAAHDLRQRFDAVVASGDYARGKPFPDPYLKVAERLGIAPGDCLALENSHNGVRSAAAAGMITVMIPDLLPATDEIRALCHFVAADLHEVSAFLTRP